MKRTVLIMLLVAVLLVAGCEGDSETRLRADPFIGGTEGLQARYIEGYPPSSVLDGGEDEFSVIVELTNKGEAEIEPQNVKVTLGGFSARHFNKGIEDLTRFNSELIEKNQKNPDGSIIESFPYEIEFEGFSYQDRIQGNQEYPFRAEICYGYQTNVVSSVCVKEDFRRDTADRDICTVNSRRTVHNSAAPVQVTNLQQTAASTGSARVTFKVENVGRGDVYKVGAEETCNVDSRDINMVHVEISGFETGAGEEVDCRGLRDGDSTSGFLNIGGDTGGEVSCTISFADGTRSARIQNFDITLDYDYRQTITRSIVVEHGS